MMAFQPGSFISKFIQDEEIDHEEIHHENIGWRLYFWMIDNVILFFISKSMNKLQRLKTDPFGLAENSMSRIDRYAQICFPIFFFAFCSTFTCISIRHTISISTQQSKKNIRFECRILAQINSCKISQKYLSQLYQVFSKLIFP